MLFYTFALLLFYKGKAAKLFFFTESFVANMVIHRIIRVLIIPLGLKSIGMLVSSSVITCDLLNGSKWIPNTMYMYVICISVCLTLIPTLLLNASLICWTCHVRWGVGVFHKKGRVLLFIPGQNVYKVIWNIATYKHPFFEVIHRYIINRSNTLYSTVLWSQLKVIILSSDLNEPEYQQ